VDPLDPAVVSIGKLENEEGSTTCGCGHTFNVIAGNVTMHGTARSFSDPVQVSEPSKPMSTPGTGATCPFVCCVRVCCVRMCACVLCLCVCGGVGILWWFAHRLCPVMFCSSFTVAPVSLVHSHNFVVRVECGGCSTSGRTIPCSGSKRDQCLHVLANQYLLVLAHLAFNNVPVPPSRQASVQRCPLLTSSTSAG
jgi:hypothetical protein